MKWIDLPPVWLAGFAALAWGLSRWRPLGLDLGGLALWSWLGGALILAGLILAVLAAREMARARTTIIPHRQPDALVTSGIFRVSRNPIYLGDVLILTGLILWWEAVIALPLVPLFAYVLTRRFIRPEEARLAAAFGPAFRTWRARVRRWI